MLLIYPKNQSLSIVDNCELINNNNDPTIDCFYSPFVQLDHSYCYKQCVKLGLSNNRIKIMTPNTNSTRTLNFEHAILNRVF